jgi:hypothetical protein
MSDFLLTLHFFFSTAEIYGPAFFGSSIFHQRIKLIEQICISRLIALAPHRLIDIPSTD